MVAPAGIQRRLDDYCAARGRTPLVELGYGVDGHVWRTDSDTVVKVYRNSVPFQHELGVYQRLAARAVTRLQGFAIPILIDHDPGNQILEMSLVSAPFVLDFGAATLDRPPSGFNPDDAAWQAEKQRLYGADWPDVRRLLDALRQYGIHYPDVHLGNIRPRA